MLTDTQQKFLEASKKFEDMKKEYKIAKEELQGLMVEIGVDSELFQDLETLLVYRIIKPTGTFVNFPLVGYERTKILGTTERASLSKKDAEAAGFTLT